LSTIILTIVKEFSLAEEKFLIEMQQRNVIYLTHSHGVNLKESYAFHFSLNTV